MFMFGGLRSLVLKSANVNIDNLLFKFHYRITVVILIAAGLLVTSHEYFGSPISCGPTPSQVTAAMLDMYCWTRSTFNLPEALGKVDVDVPYPGIDKSVPGERRFYQSYYQWVWLVLFIQAMMFYIPRYVWKNLEGKRQEQLTTELNHPLIPETSCKERRNLLIEYIVTTWHEHNVYMWRYYFCELLNFINVVGQIFFINWFLGGTFFKFGVQVAQYSEEQENRTDPMVFIFPRMTKCTFRTFGPSGDVQRYDALCVLPLNIINEKIYIFLWFWLIILAIPSGLMLIYRIIVIFFPRLRKEMFRLKLRRSCSPYLLHILNRCDLGDWFLIGLLEKNIDEIIFKQFIVELAEKVNTKH